MRLDIAPARYKHPRDVTIDHRVGERVVAGVLDGWGDWGRGPEAAERCRRFLDARWSEAADLTPEGLREDFRSAFADVPAEWIEEEFGCAFSIAIALAHDSEVHIAAAGRFGVTMVERGYVPLFHPERFTDRPDVKAALTPEQRAAHPLHGVFPGPWLPDGKGTIPRVVGPFPFAPGAKLVIADADVLDRLDERRPGIDAISAQALQDLDGRREKPVVVMQR